ncbi:MFS transporter [Nocardia sp. NBC_01327]|uniref:MFS transporter n=1 Tax=Nocardia sp. NBC_01327 TaxID=2903593 RepID=UPI002E1046AC|nr:MFS transporter [Nocardia sp. NBC_01327]
MSSDRGGSGLPLGEVAEAPRASARQWSVLVVVSLAQLMIALDATVMNVALPSAQADLGFSDSDRGWVITSYTLAFGGLLLIGGRISDLLGRRRALIIGLTGFAVSSGVAGAARNLVELAAARAAQGAFAALLAPAVLGLVSVTFTDPRLRAKAFAVFGAIAGGGGAIGLVLGGLLTQTLSWRWCCYVNIALVGLVLAAGWSVLPGDRQVRRERLDITGAALVTGGITAVVFGFSQAAKTGWTSMSMLAPLALGVVALALFWLWEARVPNPLLPLDILRNRNRIGAVLTVACAVAGLLALFLFLTYYLQSVLGFSPLRAGTAFLPLSLAVFVSAQLIAGRWTPRVAPRTLIVPGLLAAALAMLLLTQLTPTSRYVTGVLPALVLLGAGVGCVFAPAISVATADVPHSQAGVVAAVVNAGQQVGGSLGVAVLNTVAAGAAARFLAHRPDRSAIAAVVHGYTTATAWAAALLFLAAIAAGLLINAHPRREQQ